MGRLRSCTKFAGCLRPCPAWTAVRQKMLHHRLPPHVGPMIEKLLAQDPEDRPTSAQIKPEVTAAIASSITIAQTVLELGTEQQKEAYLNAEDCEVDGPFLKALRRQVV